MSPEVRTPVPEVAMKFAVTCPECALQSISQLSIATIANALLTGKSIRLYAACHDQYWTATFIEREQLRKILAAPTPPNTDFDAAATWRDLQSNYPNRAQK